MDLQGRRRAVTCPPRAFRTLAYGLALLAGLALPVQAEENAAPGFPRITAEADLGLYTVADPGASERARRGSTTFLFGHLAAGLHLTSTFSLNLFFHPDPAGDLRPNGGDHFLRRQGAFFEQLFAEWRPWEELRLFGGKFNAPFGFGHEAFPGVLVAFRAHEVYLVREQLGAGATWTLPVDPAWGEHRLTATLSTLDTSALSYTFFTHKRCCAEGYERYSRNALREGGAGNTGHLDNVVVALEGHDIAWVPGFSYHLSLLSRGPGKDGTRREWGWSVGAQYELRWTAALGTLLFGEYVEFRNADGAPLEAPGSDASPAPLRETRRFSTLGAQTTYGPWRATLAWQRDERKRSFNTLPTEQYLEVSVGRELFWGFGIDIGYQYARYARDDGGIGHSNAFVSRLGFHRHF